ncbi:MAG: hypothetical protein KDK40_00390 [Chlamydiia bacterium]|nr:hypothetical protein [Chlamydiia bacterium]
MPLTRSQNTIRPTTGALETRIDQDKRSIGGTIGRLVLQIFRIPKTTDKVFGKTCSNLGPPHLITCQTLKARFFISGSFLNGILTILSLVSVFTSFAEGIQLCKIAAAAKRTLGEGSAFIKTLQSRGRVRIAAAVVGFVSTAGSLVQIAGVIAMQITPVLQTFGNLLYSIGGFIASPIGFVMASHAALKNLNIEDETCAKLKILYEIKSGVDAQEESEEKRVKQQLLAYGIRKLEYKKWSNRFSLVQNGSVAVGSLISSVGLISAVGAAVLQVVGGAIALTGTGVSLILRAGLLIKHKIDKRSAIKNGELYVTSGQFAELGKKVFECLGSGNTQFDLNTKDACSSAELYSYLIDLGDESTTQWSLSSNMKEFFSRFDKEILKEAFS